MEEEEGRVPLQIWLLKKKEILHRPRSGKKVEKVRAKGTADA